MAMEYDGKTYRNLQEQVAYLTAKWQQLADEIDEVRAQIPSKMIVEELPEEGDPLITYYVGPKGTAPNQYYEVWIWVQEEEDGPFVWRELEDTDQVDLSGYLPIQNGVTTYAQVYGKATDGTQTMFNMTTGVEGNTVARRTSSGLLRCANAQSSEDAVNQGYADGRYLAKQTGTTTSAQLYRKNADGTQSMQNMSIAATGNTVVQRDGEGRVGCAEPTTDGHAVNKGYADSTYLAKQTGTTTNPQVYIKNADGTQTMETLADYSLVASSVVRRTGASQIRVPTTPTNDNDATSKKYVDDAVGQLLYLHDIVLAYDIDGTNSLFIRCFLISGSATALTALSRETFARLTIGAGGIGTGASNVVTPCAITKLPESFRFDALDEAYDGFLYQYFSGGSLVSASVESGANTLTVTDSVTTW